jgi:hypothetical protein|eukprot:COSAG01_NODE_132_length_24759_cov_13.862298_2_plen_50_part_00
MGIVNSTGTLADMNGGTVKFTVKNGGTSGSFNLLLSTDAFPSFITTPFS